MKRLIKKQCFKTITLEQLFHEKYPTGNINKKSGTYSVYFNEGGKVYSYRAKNNIDIIKKLKLSNENLMYQYTYDSYIKELDNQKLKLKNIENGVEEENLFFDTQELTDEEK